MPLASWTSPCRSSAHTTSVSLAVYRNGTFIDFYTGPLLYSLISSLIDDASHSQVLLDCPSADRFFVLRSPTCVSEFEDVAFLFRHSKEAFCFTESADFSLTFYNRKLGVERGYDGSVSIPQFVQSCAIAKPQKFDSVWDVTPGNHSLVAMLSRPERMVKGAMDFVTGKYSSVLRGVVLKWGRGTDRYLELCRISQNDATIVMISAVHGS
jgi:hypothetical protein